LRQRQTLRQQRQNNQGQPGRQTKENDAMLEHFSSSSWVVKKPSVSTEEKNIKTNSIKRGIQLLTGGNVTPVLF
jgi:hypothetical protein